MLVPEGGTKHFMVYFQVLQIWHFEWPGGVITYSVVSYDKLYISAVRQAYLDTTGLCAFDEGYAPYSLHLIPIGGSAHRL